jgi:hypothetical protein
VRLLITLANMLRFCWLRNFPYGRLVIFMTLVAIALGLQALEAIKEAEAHWSKDLAISYGWPDRILHGSDAEGVLRRAPCPVLIAKEPNQTRISPILN